MRSVLLGGTIIVANTLLPVLVWPAETVGFLVQFGIQSLILAATTTGGWASRRVAAAEEAALAALAAASADRSAHAARLECRELQRQIHDIVLNVLSALTLGGLGDSAEVRRDCAGTAQFLRTRRLSDELRTPVFQAR